MIGTTSDGSCALIPFRAPTSAEEVSCSEVSCGEVKCRAVKCSAVKLSEVQWSEMKCVSWRSEKLKIQLVKGQKLTPGKNATRRLRARGYTTTTPKSEVELSCVVHAGITLALSLHTSSFCRMANTSAWYLADWPWVPSTFNNNINHKQNRIRFRHPPMSSTENDGKTVPLLTARRIH